MFRDKPVVLATTNVGKIKELAEPLSRQGLKLIGLNDLDERPEIVENGTTFAQNALIKARTVAEFSNLVTIADDSGLMVDCLKGEPGIYSARFADDWPLLEGETHDQRNIRKLLALLEGVPLDKRGARFVCAMACVRPDGRTMTVEGQWEGRILTHGVGENGFGYDPVFFDPIIGVSAACLTAAEKNLVSHRGKALRVVLSRLEHFLDLPKLSG